MAANAWLWTIATPTGGTNLKPVSALNVKIFADGADKAAMLRLYTQKHIRGFTTDPTLMRKAGITGYAAFARDILEAIPDRPISFEVFAGDCTEMERQARIIASWGPNVYVKIPVTNTRRESSAELFRHLAQSGVKLNVTAIMPLDQVREISTALAGGPPSCISVFAGRVADTGVDPLPLMKASLEIIRPHPEQEPIWGEPPRPAQRTAGRRHWLSHHHGNYRYAAEARLYRQGLTRVFSRHRQDVPWGCGSVRFCPLKDL
jgi:transaldolase